jgi:hypothetical protein
LPALNDLTISEMAQLLPSMSVADCRLSYAVAAEPQVQTRLLGNGSPWPAVLMAVIGHPRSKLSYKVTVVKFPATIRSRSRLTGSCCLAAAIVAREGRDLRSSGARASGDSAAR